MDDGGSARMNAAAVKRVDPYARDIVETSSHVALYSFDDGGWIKTEIEGALFVYSRRGPPHHGVIVMNRLSTDNLIEPITDGLELQLQRPFLLYRNAKRRIFGLWFYDGEECARVAATVERLAALDAKRREGAPESPKRRPVDVFGMLSRAQLDYEAARPPTIASQSVADFFAKAGAPGPPSLDRAAADHPAILQRLMSDPVHSVEHIEKQQRSVTPKRKTNGHADPPKPEPPPPPSEPQAQADPPKPALMPPTMFVAKAPPPTEPRPEPLTRNQLLQALNYLIKNDAEFVTKLHEAYVKSFSELVS